MSITTKTKHFDDTRRDCEQIIELFKQRMVDALKDLNAPARVYFDFGRAVTCMLDSAYTMGREDEARLNENK